MSPRAQRTRVVSLINRMVPFFPPAVSGGASPFPPSISQSFPGEEVSDGFPPQGEGPLLSPQEKKRTPQLRLPLLQIKDNLFFPLFFPSSVLPMADSPPSFT